MNRFRRVYEYTIKPAWQLVRGGHFGYFMGAAIERGLGWNPYIQWRHWRGLNSQKLIDLGQYQLYIDLEDRGLSRHLLIRGAHEPSAVQAYIEAIDEICGNKQSILTLEVGANLGYFTHELIARFEDRISIVAFEPDPANRALLEQNVQHNSNCDNVTISKLAVSSNNETVPFLRSERSNWSRIVDGEATSGSSTKQISVEATTVDSYLSNSSLAVEDVCAVRMDLEGHEMAVLSGMESLLSANTPLVMYVEFHPSSVGHETFQNTLETLREKGFSPRFIGQDWEEYTPTFETLLQIDGSHVRTVLVRESP